MMLVININILGLIITKINNLGLIITNIISLSLGKPAEISPSVALLEPEYDVFMFSNKAYGVYYITERLA